MTKVKKNDLKDTIESYGYENADGTNGELIAKYTSTSNEGSLLAYFALYPDLVFDKVGNDYYIYGGWYKVIKPREELSSYQRNIKKGKKELL